MNKERYKEKKHSAVIGIFICFILTVALFIALVLFQKSIVDGDGYVSVVVAAKDISANNELVSPDNVTDLFKVIKIQKSASFDGAYNSLESLVKDGKIYITSDLKENEILSEAMTAPYSIYLDQFIAPIEMGIQVSSFEKAAGGTLRRGDSVELCAIDDSGNEYSIFLYILKAFDSEGLIIDSSDTVSVAQAFNVLVEKTDYATVAQIVTMNDFDLVKISGIE